MAFRRRSLLKKPGLKENLRLWLSIEVGELASFTEQDLKRVVSGTHFGNEGFLIGTCRERTTDHS